MEFIFTIVDDSLLTEMNFLIFIILMNLCRRRWTLLPSLVMMTLRWRRRIFLSPWCWRFLAGGDELFSSSPVLMIFLINIHLVVCPTLRYFIFFFLCVVHFVRETSSVQHWDISFAFSGDNFGANNLLRLLWVCGAKQSFSLKGRFCCIGSQRMWRGLISFGEAVLKPFARSLPMLNLLVQMDENCLD